MNRGRVAVVVSSGYPVTSDPDMGVVVVVVVGVAAVIFNSVLPFSILRFLISVLFSENFLHNDQLTMEIDYDTLQSAHCKHLSNE